MSSFHPICIMIIQSKSCCCCSVTKSGLTLWDPMDWSMPGSPVLHNLPDFAQTHVHWVRDAIQQSHPPLPTSPPVLSLSQHQHLFQWVGCLHQVAKVLELAFSVMQWMLAIWSLVLLPFLNPACTYGSSWFTYYWSLAWRILSIIFQGHEMCAIVQ